MSRKVCKVFLASPSVMTQGALPPSHSFRPRFGAICGHTAVPAIRCLRRPAFQCVLKGETGPREAIWPRCVHHGHLEAIAGHLPGHSDLQKGAWAVHPQHLQLSPAPFPAVPAIHRQRGPSSHGTAEGVSSDGGAIWPHHQRPDAFHAPAMGIASDGDLQEVGKQQVYALST